MDAFPKPAERAFRIFGFAALAVGLTLIGLIVYTMVFGADAPGFASIMVAVLGLGGLQLLSLGIMGEYVGRIATEVRGRPLYVVASTVGFDREGAA